MTESLVWQQPPARNRSSKQQSVCVKFIMHLPPVRSQDPCIHPGSKIGFNRVSGSKISIGIEREDIRREARDRQAAR